MAKVEIMVRKKKRKIVEDGVSEILPASEFLGTDMPELAELLQKNVFST